MKNISLSIVLLFLAPALALAGGVHKWVDAEGNVHYGDRPPSENGARVETVEVVNFGSSDARRTAPPPRGTHLTLTEAIEANDRDATLGLVRSGAHVDRSDLSKAVKLGYADILQLLLNAREATLATVQPSPADVARNMTMIADQLLPDAVSFDRDVIAQALIDLGADVNKRGGHDPYLIIAVRSQFRTMLKVLLDNGADVSVGNHAALRDATKEGDIQTMRMLIAAGSDVNATGKRGSGVRGTTALYEAARYGHPEAVALLIKHGAELETSFDFGSTALSFARSKKDSERHQQIVQLLTDAGALR